jgi:hypothetical protein
MSAKIILLDRALAHYGPETKEVRDLLRHWARQTHFKLSIIKELGTRDFVGFSPERMDSP